MERKELALKLLNMQSKLDKFWYSLQSVGLDPAESPLSEVDVLTVVLELYGITNDDDEHEFRLKWSQTSNRLNASKTMVATLEKHVNK